VPPVVETVKDVTPDVAVRRRESASWNFMVFFWFGVLRRRGWVVAGVVVWECVSKWMTLLLNENGHAFEP